MTTAAPSHLLIVTGLSGSGKSVALRALEDLEFFCVDNLPAALLPQFVDEIRRTPDHYNRKVAIGIDVRNPSRDLADLPTTLTMLSDEDIRCEVLFVQADEATLIKRFSETRRPHPLRQADLTLTEALREERKRLEAIASHADLFLDTTNTNIHQLRRLVWSRIGRQDDGLCLLLESFAFKQGVPPDVDFVFDVRCLPNPHWEPELRMLTGRDSEVRNYLLAQPLTTEMYQEILEFLQHQLPRFEHENRSYLTVGIGCTGGRHRSVFMVEQLAWQFRQGRGNTLIHHREL